MISKLISLTQSVELMEIRLSEHSELIGDGDDGDTIAISPDTFSALMINNDTSIPRTAIRHSYR